MAQLDAQLVALLNTRARAARRIGELRREHPASLPIGDHGAIRELVAQSAADMPQQPLREILSAVFAACLALELPVHVAFAGPAGGPAHAAARGRFGQTASLAGVDTVASAIDEVSRKHAEYAVVPFETSAEGPVQATIAALVASELRVVEVLEAPLSLHMCNRSGQVVDVHRVYVTPTDHAACEHFFESLSPRPAIVMAATPLSACEQALAEPDGAAIASEGLATSTGLLIARHNVQASAGARIRYAVVGARPSGRTGNELTSFVFSVQSAPGSLNLVLRVLADREIRLTKIHSHPVEGEAWTYLFFAETAGHFTDRPLVMAFEEIKRVARFFKVLGSYPVP